MRGLLSLVVVGLIAAPAAANPRAGATVVPRMVVGRDATLPAAPEPTRRAEPVKREAHPSAHAKSERPEVTMPVLWSGVRDKIYDQLPRGGRDRGFSYTVTPMAITGIAETVPGLGISGSF